ncbi:MAG: hypothetical protein Q9166_001942 [cf. Caloplaca sp. 2 TL-2023]
MANGIMWDPSHLTAYSTVPLTQPIISGAQNGFYYGTSARWSDPEVVLTIDFRTDFINASHYDIRTALDAEGLLSPFVILDENTPEDRLNAVWFVETTEQCRRDSEGTYDRITYPYENFTLWQIHIRTPDLPITESAWSIGVGALVESLVHPYDPHDPQLKYIFHYERRAPNGTDLGPLNWTDPSQSLWGGRYLSVDASEVEWSRDPRILKLIDPGARFAVRLRDEAARRRGMKSLWYPKDKIERPGEEVELMTMYDDDGPLWSNSSEARAAVQGDTRIVPAGMDLRAHWVFREGHGDFKYVGSRGVASTKPPNTTG